MAMVVTSLVPIVRVVSAVKPLQLVVIPQGMSGTVTGLAATLNPAGTASGASGETTGTQAGTLTPGLNVTWTKALQNLSGSFSELSSYVDAVTTDPSQVSYTSG